MNPVGSFLTVLFFIAVKLKSISWLACLDEIHTKIITMNFRGHPRGFLSYGWSRSIYPPWQPTAATVQTENYLSTLTISSVPSWGGVPLWGFTRVCSFIAHFYRRTLGCNNDLKGVFPQVRVFSWRFSDAVLTSITLAGFSGKVRLPPSGQPQPQCSRDAVSYLVGGEAGCHLLKLCLGDACLPIGVSWLC